MPATNKLLFEAGYTPFRYQPIFGHPSPDANLDLIAVTEQSNAINPATGQPFAPATNYRYRAVPNWGPATGNTDDVQASASYVTGAHSAKFGYQMRRLDLLDKDQANHTQLAYRFNQGVPNAVTYYMPNFGRRTITKSNSVFAQDSWTHGRLTLQGALRWDRATSFAPVELNGTTDTSFLNPTPVTIQKTAGVDAYNNITPRAGVAYDLFGNGKTALKFNYGKYLAYAANDSPYTSTNPGATIVRTVNNRGWTDSNNNKVVDCNLLNPDLNGECSALAGNDRNFGQLGGATKVCGADGIVANGCGDSVLDGWGTRPGDTQYTWTVQQQVIPRVSVDASYTHRTFNGFFITDDLTHHAGGTFAGPVTGYESYTVNVPTDARLPDGGGYPVTVFVATPAAGAVPANNYLVREETFGEPRDSHWDGFEYNGNARFRGGLTLSAGASTGRGVVNTCASVQKYGSTNPRDCNNVEDWLTTARGLVSYTVPKVDVLVSATVRSTPPLQQTVTWQVNTAQVITPILGHAPFGSTATTNITVTDSDHKLYMGGRRNTVDMRFAKVIRFTGRRADIGVDLNNAFNTNYPTAYNGTIINGTDLANTPRVNGFLAPTAIYNPRFVRFNFTLNF